MHTQQLEAIRHRLETANRVLVTSHIRPDGDAVGSILGFGLGLMNAGKSVQIALEDGVPKSFRHLSGSELITKDLDGSCDCIFVLDCSDVSRVGDILDKDRIPEFNIDHHVTNDQFAEVNLVDTKAVATAEIIVEVLRFLGCPIDQKIASALLTGLVTDTLGFRTQNITSKALRLAADLLDCGVDLSDLYRKALIDLTYATARYHGRGLTKLQREGKMVWTNLTLEDRLAAGYPGNDDGDLINTLSAINEADVAMIFIEQKDQKVKVSWRSRGALDVSHIAFGFGGGGHKPAAGATITGSLEDVQSLVLAATRDLFI